MKQLTATFQYLSEAEINEGIEFAASQLIKLGKFSTKEEAVSYVNTVMTKMGENKYRVRFISIFQNIDITGIALKDNATKRIYNEMRLQASILTHFSTLNYSKSPVCFTVHNARSVFAATPYNSTLTINA